MSRHFQFLRGKTDISGISIQIPRPIRNIVKFPTPGKNLESNSRRLPGGGGCWSFELIGT